jgi:hypothetical protein
MATYGSSAVMGVYIQHSNRKRTTRSRGSTTSISGREILSQQETRVGRASDQSAVRHPFERNDGEDDVDS